MNEIKERAGRGRQEGQKSLERRLGRGQSRGEKASGRAARQSTISLACPALHHARVYIIKHRMKYSLLLPLDAGFIFVEGKSPMRKSALSKTPGLSERWGNATDTVWRRVYG